jgi:APA family basic amino acid/polyamine antiporter
LNIWARKPIEDLCSEAAVGSEVVTALPRSVGFFALTCFGVGSTVGAGIFVLTGTVAAEHAGPAVALSFLLASCVCLLAGLCYAELASMIPVAGSAYSYTYATLGEAVAWTVGWCLVLEYLFSVSLVAISWSGYAQSTLHQFGWSLPEALSKSPFDVRGSYHVFWTGTLIDLPAVLITAFCTLVLLGGVRLSAGFNNVIVVAKVLAILVVVAVGFGHVHPANWAPFIPPNTGAYGVYGWSGVMQGTAILFFAYIGFDAVSTMGREAREPQKSIPASLIASLAICAVLYLATSVAITGMASYHDLDVPDPVYAALDRAGPSVAWAKSLVGFVAVVGLVSVVLVTLLGQVRIFYAMGKDGLLPEAFARVHPVTRTPHIGTIVAGIVAAIAAGLLPLGLLGELISMGTLLAFAIVCGGVLVLRSTRPEMPRPFRVPLCPWIPGAGVLACLGLMWTLPNSTWLRLVFWLIIGALIYGLYGVRRSRLQQSLAASQSEPPNTPYRSARPG